MRIRLTGVEFIGLSRLKFAQRKVANSAFKFYNIVRLSKRETQ
jgi:hypothetical protein